ncbi:MAG TPA: hypothetical protein VNT76_01610, partial [Candidatus Binatus sp.]|nr:hypothetical protein [Candidatus Binatus sp.]
HQADTSHGGGTANGLSWCDDRRVGLVLVGLIFIMHGIGLLLLFNPVQGLFDTNPIIDQDWGLHFFHLKSLENFWRRDHLLTGYNPYFMAGYPSNTIQDLSIKFFEFTALALATLSLTTVQWFKLSAFAGMASVPWLMYLSARNFFAADVSKNVTALSAALLGTIYWWNSLPREMFFYGMIGFPIAAYVSVWGLSLFYRIAADSNQSTSIVWAWLIFAVTILPLHVQAIVIFVPPMLALLVYRRKHLPPYHWLWILGAALLALIVNSPWLMPALAHRGDDVSKSIVDQLPLFASADTLTFLIDYLGTKGYWTFRPSMTEKGFRLVLLILGSCGIYRLIRSADRRLGITLACGVTFLFLISYFGALIPAFKAWQTLRFKVPYDLYLSLAAAYTTAQWVKGLNFRFTPWMLGAALTTFAINLAQTESTGRLQMRTEVRPEIQSVIDWIRDKSSMEARLLFEESGDETGFVYDGSYLSSLIALRTDRQLIGGPINLYNDRHHFAELHSGKFLKRDIASFTDDELRNYFSLYNIGAIVAFHPTTLGRLQAIPGLVTVERRMGPVSLMKVNHGLSWFVEGQGRVSAGFNRLELSELKGNTVVLKYHWIDGLRAEPATKLEPVKLADDPIPFIKLINPPINLTLRFGS